jgi:hypothetical protein
MIYYEPINNDPHNSNQGTQLNLEASDATCEHAGS